MNFEVIGSRQSAKKIDDLSDSSLRRNVTTGLVSLTAHDSRLTTHNSIPLLRFGMTQGPLSPHDSCLTTHHSLTPPQATHHDNGHSLLTTHNSLYQLPSYLVNNCSSDLFLLPS